MVVHAYDLFFYLSSWSTISYLWSDQRRYVLGLIGALLAIGFAARIAYHARRHSCGSRPGRRSPPPSSSPWPGMAPPNQRRAGATCSSTTRNLYVLLLLRIVGRDPGGVCGAEHCWRPRRKRAAATAAFTIPGACDNQYEAAAHHPDPRGIGGSAVAVQAAQLRPTPSIRCSCLPTPTCTRCASRTYGGASWLTEFSLLAGVSTHSFRRHAAVSCRPSRRNKLKDTLPQALGRAVRISPTFVFYPMMRKLRVQRQILHVDRSQGDLRHEVARGTFGAGTRPASTSKNSLAEMEQHLKTSRKPMFMFIQTMVGALAVRLRVQPGDRRTWRAGPGTDPEMHEYLRSRLPWPRWTSTFPFWASCISAFPGREVPGCALRRPSSDGHTHAARLQTNDTEAEDVALHPDSIGFVTYYAPARGVNYRVPPLPQFETLDVPYVGTVILDLAGLPLVGFTH